MLVRRRNQPAFPPETNLAQRRLQRILIKRRQIIDIPQLRPHPFHRRRIVALQQFLHQSLAVNTGGILPLRFQRRRSRQLHQFLVPLQHPGVDCVNLRRHRRRQALAHRCAPGSQFDWKILAGKSMVTISPIDPDQDLRKQTEAGITEHIGHKQRMVTMIQPHQRDRIVADQSLQILPFNQLSVNERQHRVPLRLVRRRRSR